MIGPRQADFRSSPDYAKFTSNGNGIVSRVGIMQGRLVPPEPGRFQSFPRSRWQDEISLARQVPLSYIEWIYDLYGADVNPVMEGIPRGFANWLTT